MRKQEFTEQHLILMDAGEVKHVLCRWDAPAEVFHGYVEVFGGPAGAIVQYNHYKRSHEIDDHVIYRRVIV